MIQNFVDEYLTLLVLYGLGGAWGISWGWGLTYLYQWHTGAGLTGTAVCVVLTAPAVHAFLSLRSD